MSKSLLILLFILSQMSCASNFPLSVLNKTLVNEANVNVEISSINTLVTELLVKVFGSVSITGIGRELSEINLNCIALNVDDTISSDIYIDSAAHVLTSNFKAVNNKVNAKVYWVFQGVTFKKEPHQFKILVKENCLTDIRPRCPQELCN